VAITRGQRIKPLSPGIVWYWPFWTSIYHRAATIQTKDLKTQTLMTKDHKTVAAGCMVRYCIPQAWSEEPTRIDNADIKALIETDDVDQAITDETLAVLCEYVTNQGVDTINADRSVVNKTLTNKVRSVLRSYGVYVLRAQLTDFAIGLPVIHIGALWRDTNGSEE
jgi:regulator of protease activity HflC (stomatin/prohibitin superfamily)